MPQCRVCHKELNNPARPCPRCGFQEPAFFGDPNKANQVINQKADAFRNQYLSAFDFGLTIYYWKDQNGQLVLDRTQRLSFGIGSNLAGNVCWLDQPFARIPEVEKLDLELSILRENQNYRKLYVAVPVPQGNHLLQAGISLSRDMTVQLMLKNPQGQAQSTEIPFLLD